MITLHNLNGDDDEDNYGVICRYQVKKDGQVICSFNHDPEEGVVVALQKAAEAALNVSNIFN